jgi:two-component system, OmpR family, phosphate regulon sensor histidine kinase PhoR
VRRKRRSPIVAAYVLSLLVTIALLVVWVVYVVRSVSRLDAVAGRVGVAGEQGPWIILTVGCALFFLLIAGLTWQLAQALAARRYSLKQEEFVSNVTHELKTPLAAIKLHAQTLREGGLQPAQQVRSLELVLQQADRMTHLVDDVLESSRLLARRRPLALEPLDVGEFFAGYFAEAAPRVEAQGVQLAWRLDSGARVLASPDALDRVMNNLLDNAARFSQRGGEVRCRVADADGQVRIEVEDDGVGIPRKELPHVFDRFYQAGNERDGRRRGTGLGLAIVAGLVQEMRGKVEAESHEGRRGATFTVELPALRGAPRESPS